MGHSFRLRPIPHVDRRRASDEFSAAPDGGKRTVASDPCSKSDCIDPGCDRDGGIADGSSVPVLEMVGLSTGSVGNLGLLPFEQVTTAQALDVALENGRKEEKAIVLDFTADWCVECKIMDRVVFGNSEVVKRLRDVLLIRIDATDYNDEIRKLMSRFNVVGPPTIVFIKSPGTTEVPDTRIIGPVNVAAFLARLDHLRRTTTLTQFGE